MKVSRRSFAKTSAAVGAGLTFGSVANALGEEKPTASRPNFLWIVAEDISPFFGCYGDPDAATPHIDEYAKRSHVFARAFSTAPICAPSRSCMATGMYATSLGTQNLRSSVKFPDGLRPLTQVFRDNGYWVANRNKTDYNFDAQGLFDYWKDDLAPWRSCPDDKPFYAFMNLGSTHEGSGNHASRAEPALKRLPAELKHDPDTIALPPYFADTTEMRRLWARYYDLLTVYDIDVHNVLETLEAGGRSDDTIVFLMADHGMGLPRYKRWLYLTGMHVPLIIHVPKKYQHLTKLQKQASVQDGLVSYVDLPPTVLNMAGIDIPENFQGQPLFTSKSRQYVYGARDRADDMYDLSRSVFDGRYMYIRHYMPHMVPMQEGVIMSPYNKEFNQELYRVHEAGQDTEQSAKLWSPRPYEELYDIENDPQELNNLAEDKSLREVKFQLTLRLREWIILSRDSGFLTEPEMHRRANALGVAPYTMMQSEEQYPVREIFAAAENASLPNSDLMQPGKDDDPMVVYWAIQQRIIRDKKNDESVQFIRQYINHSNPTVRTVAAEALARFGKEKEAYPAFRELLLEEEPNQLLYVARSLAISLDDVHPIENEVRQARERMLAPPGSPRPWKDFNYSAFTTWALEWALIKSGLNTPEDFGLRS
jgi:arylsulfatase A-like enzyme